MNFSTTKDGIFCIIKVEGRLDALTSDLFANTVRDFIKQGEHNIKIDATAINYISSAGLRALLLCYRDAQGVKGSFAISAASESVKNVIDMSGMQLLLCI